VERIRHQEPGISENRSAAASSEAEWSEDARLLTQVANGKENALAELYRRRSKLIYSLLARMLDNEIDAQETLQDAFVLIWKRAHRYDGGRSSPLSWMVMLAHGLARDRLRAASRRNRNRAVFEREIVALEIEINTPRPAERDELARACAAALNHLPEEQGRALQLAFYRGWTHEEIAGALNEPLGTVKARIRRALLALRKKLKEYES